MESYDREKGRPKAYIYTLCWKLNPSQVESISQRKSQSSTLVWCHSCLKMPMQLPYSTLLWIWSRKMWNIWIQIRLQCWQWTSCPGVGIFMLRWPGEWLNGSEWPGAVTTAGTVLQNLLWKHLILQGQDMPTSSRVPSFLMWCWAWTCCQLQTVANTGGGWKTVV